MIALVAVVILLAAAPAAVAKEITKVEVCGQGACNVLAPGDGPPGDGITQRDLLELTEVVGPADPPTAASGWFRVRVTIEHHGADASSWTNAWVPSARLLSARDETGKGYTWFTVPRDTALSFRKVTRMLDPLPAATLRGLAKLPPRVDSVIAAPGQPARGDGAPWGWIALAVALACLMAIGWATAPGVRAGRAASARRPPHRPRRARAVTARRRR
jgi:hypothetical protein